MSESINIISNNTNLLNNKYLAGLFRKRKNSYKKDIYKLNRNEEKIIESKANLIDKSITNTNNKLKFKTEIFNEDTNLNEQFVYKIQNKIASRDDIKFVNKDDLILFNDIKNPIYNEFLESETKILNSYDISNKLIKYQLDKNIKNIKEKMNFNKKNFLIYSNQLKKIKSMNIKNQFKKINKKSKNNIIVIRKKNEDFINIQKVKEKNKNENRYLLPSIYKDIKFHWVSNILKRNLEVRYDSTFTRVGNFAYLYGGFGTDYKKTMVVLNLLKNDFQTVKPNNHILPSTRKCHVALEFKKKLLIYGGETFRKEYLLLNDIQLYDPDRNEWSEIYQENNHNLYKKNHIGFILQNYLFIHGGETLKNQLTNELMAFNFETLRWIEIKLDNPTEKLSHHECCIVKFTDNLDPFKNPENSKEGVYVFGGRNEKGEINNILRIFKPKKNNWKIDYPKTNGIPPSPRYNHCIHYLKNINSILIYGGRNDFMHSLISEIGLNDINLLDIESYKWINVIISGNLENKYRYSFSSFNYQNKIYIFGGLKENEFLGGGLDVLDTNQDHKKKKFNY